VGASATIVLGCAGSDSDSGGTSNGDTGGTTDTGSGTCASTNEGEIGPYFADDSDPRFNRSNILPNVDGTEAQTGIPLTLTITVLDGEQGCAPYPGAQIDVWHCNASGVYSDEDAESTSTKSWLRGYQITDASGKVTFQTILPGWYSGRTTHIHLRIRSTYGNASSTSDGSNTTQLFFDQTLIDTVATTVAPYDAEGKNPTTNALDHVYSGETKGTNLVSLSGDATSGYTTALTVVLPIAG